MFIALFILLLVAQPAKGQSVEITSPQNKIQSYRKQDSTRDTINFFSKRDTICAQNPKTDSNKTTNPSDEKEKSIFIRFAEWIGGIRWTDWLLVLGTWVLAGTGIYQAKRAHKNSQMELRAYLAADGDFSPFVLFARNDGFVIRNNGQTPAYDITCRYAVVVDTEERTDFSLDNLPEFIRRAVIQGSDGQRFMPTADVPRNLQPGHEAWMYWYGRIEYKDAFGKSHFTNFRFRSATPSVSRTNRTEIEFMPNGNESD